MNCDAIRDLLPDRLDGLLDDAHLASCPACASERDAYAKFRAALYALSGRAALARAASRDGEAGEGGGGRPSPVRRRVRRGRARYARDRVARPEPTFDPLPETPPEALVPRRIV